MNKDEIQQTKALIKLKCIKRIIDLLQELNLEENESNMKQYNLILDYEKSSAFTTFKVKVDVENVFKGNTVLFDFNFKLSDEKTGFAIFKAIREYFVKKNDLQFPAFRGNNNRNNEKDIKYISHQITTNHHVNLYSMIHTKQDEQKLEKFNDRIFEQYGSYIRNIHETDCNKDVRQRKKADKKKKIAIAVLDMLNELSNADYNQGRMYDVILDCKEYDRCSEFKIQILKNKTRIFNIKFKLTNKEIGINTFNDVVKHYIETYDIAFDTYDNRHESEIRDYVIIGKNNINLNYKIPKEYFSTSMIVFKGELNKKGEKKLEKVK